MPPTAIGIGVADGVFVGTMAVFVGVFTGVIVGPVGVFVGGTTGVFVGTIGVNVCVGLPPTLTLPPVHDACIEIPFKSDKRNPLGTAAVPRKATVEMPEALARKDMLSNVPLP